MNMNKKYADLFFSEDPGLRVLMATWRGGLPGRMSLPLHTSPNSPVVSDGPVLKGALKALPF